MIGSLIPGLCWRPKKRPPDIRQLRPASPRKIQRRPMAIRAQTWPSTITVDNKEEDLMLRGSPSHNIPTIIASLVEDPMPAVIPDTLPVVVRITKRIILWTCITRCLLRTSCKQFQRNWKINVLLLIVKLYLWLLLSHKLFLLRWWLLFLKLSVLFLDTMSVLVLVLALVWLRKIFRLGLNACYVRMLLDNLCMIVCWMMLNCVTIFLKS